MGRTKEGQRKAGPTTKPATTFKDTETKQTPLKPITLLTVMIRKRKTARRRRYMENMGDVPGVEVINGARYPPKRWLIRMVSSANHQGGARVAN